MMQDIYPTAGSIGMLPSDHPDYWATRPKAQEEWVRSVCSKNPQLDESKLIVGMALDTMIYDDGNCVQGFQTTKSLKSIRPALYNRQVNDLSIRLLWESGISELPSDIKEELLKIKDSLPENDAGMVYEFEVLNNIYVGVLEFQKWLSKKIKYQPTAEDRLLKEAYDYYIERFGNGTPLEVAWQEYCKG